jgi:hypothetical protein
LAARSRRRDNTSRKKKKIDKKIEITGIITAASFIASFSTIIITGVAFEAFIGRRLRGMAAFCLSLGFLLLENWMIVAGLVKLAI